MHLGFTVQAADISIHALREEGDSKMYGRTVNDNDFYPRPPRGGRRPSSTTPISSANFYPRPPRGGRHPGGVGLLRGQNFYPRPPRGGRPAGRACCGVESLFLSTPSARRATWASTSQTSRRGYFYPRPPRGGRRTTTRSFRRTFNFYPRPPRGGRQRRAVNVTISDVFLSTPSARRAT